MNSIMNILIRLGEDEARKDWDQRPWEYISTVISFWLNFTIIQVLNNEITITENF